MKINTVLSTILLAILLSGCERLFNGTDEYSFSGKVQKGPFVSGTTITLNELNDRLGQTGRAFTTQVTGDNGQFSLDNIELESELVQITASGYYYNELYDELSGAPLTLYVITDLSGHETVNINLLTHLMKGRVEKLVSEGNPYREAMEQARSELLVFMGVEEKFEKNFEEFDITGNGDPDALLLAFSLIVQRYTMFSLQVPSLTAELTQLLARLSADFREDGMITGQPLIDTLMYNVSQLNLIDIRNNLQQKYADLGISGSVPDFEKYIGKFQEKYSDQLYTEFFYPGMASPDPVMAPDAKIPNILVSSDTIFKAGEPYSAAAIIPLNANLAIRFISHGSGSNFGVSGPIHGWEYVNQHPNGFMLNAQRQNQLMSMLMYLMDPGSAVIEYYENSSESPTYTKTIRWE